MWVPVKFFRRLQVQVASCKNASSYMQVLIVSQLLVWQNYTEEGLKHFHDI